jgi:putative hydrolase of the HAD superfamily
MRCEPTLDERALSPRPAAAPDAPIETLFLDAGGVLIHPNWERVSAIVARYGFEASAARLRQADHRAKREIDQPWIVALPDVDRARRYLTGVLVHAGMEPAAAHAAAVALGEEHRRTHLWDFVPEEVAPALDRLAEMGLDLVLVSNSNGSLRRTLRGLGLANRFSCIIDSTEVGVEKPDPRIFHLALALSGSAAESTVHLGDLYHVDVTGARAAGIRGWLLDPGQVYNDCDCPRLASLLDVPGAIHAAQTPHGGGRPC